MQEKVVFYPERRSGMIFYGIAILVLSSISIFSLWQAAHVFVSLRLILYFVLVLASIAIIAWLAYRTYGLQNASYSLDRDSIQLKWGFRFEEIPMNEIEWISPASDDSISLLLPTLYLSGAVLGKRRLPDGDYVEFLASTPRDLVLITTPEHKYAISPKNYEDFLQTFQRYTEMGSLEYKPAISIYPTTWINQVWAISTARFLLLIGFALNIILLIWIIFIISTRKEVHLGFLPDGTPAHIVPAVRLILLLVLDVSFITADILMGLFFFRRKESRPFSYILWIGGVLTPILFLFSIFFILRAS